MKGSEDEEVVLCTKSSSFALREVRRPFRPSFDCTGSTNDVIHITIGSFIQFIALIGYQTIHST